MKMTWKTVLLGIITVRATMLGLQPRVNGEMAAEIGRKWSMIDLRQLSLGPEMSAVVYDMAGVDEWGVTMHSRERFQKRVDQLDVADLRTIVLHEATSGNDRKRTNKLAEFAEMDNPAATCAAADTAGWGGIEMCTEECGNDKRYYQRISSRKQACLVLCTLAADPCAENWGMELMTKTGAMVASGVRAMTHLSNEDLSNEDKESLKLLVVVLLLVACVVFEQRDLYQQRDKERREDDNLAVSQRELQGLNGSRFFRHRPKKGRQYGLYNTRLVNYRDHQGLSKAKIDAAQRREAHWKAEAAAAAAAAAAAVAAGDAVAGAGAGGEGEGEGSKTEGAAGVAW